MDHAELHSAFVQKRLARRLPRTLLLWRARHVFRWNPLVFLEHVLTILLTQVTWCLGLLTERLRQVCRSIDPTSVEVLTCGQRCTWNKAECPSPGFYSVLLHPRRQHLDTDTVLHRQFCQCHSELNTVRKRVRKAFIRAFTTPRR